MANVGTVEATLRLKDQFSGPMARAQASMRTAGSKLSATMTKQRSSTMALSVAVLGLAYAYKKAVEAANRQERAVRLVDNGVAHAKTTFGLTSRAIQDYASDLQKATGVGDEAILESQAILLSFRQVQGQVFKDATRVALDMAEVLGVQVKDVMIQLGKALEDPERGLTALSRSGTTFTNTQKEMIKGWVEEGELVRAQTYILKEIDKQYGGAAETVRNTMGGALKALGSEWGDLLEVIGSEAGGGILRTAVESWIEALRTLKGELPDLGIAFNIVFSEAARWLVQLLTKIQLGLTNMFHTLAGITRGIPGGDKMTKFFEQAQASIVASAEVSFEILDDLAVGFEIKANDAADALKNGSDRARAAFVGLADDAEEAGSKAGTALKMIIPEKMDVEPVKAISREMERILDLQASLGMGELQQWNIELEYVKDNYGDIVALIGESGAAGLMRELSRRASDLKIEAKETKDAFGDINRGFTEAVGKGLHDAARGFLDELTDGLTSKLPKGLRIFADALLDAAKEWLIAMLKNIVIAKAASKGIGSTGSSSGSSAASTAVLSGVNWSTVGSALAAAAPILAAAAVVVGVFALRKMKRDKEKAARFETAAAVSINAAGTIDASFVGRLNQTGQAAADAMKAMINGLANAAGVAVTAMKDVTIRIRNDKKQFEVFLGGELVGIYGSLQKALMAGVKKVFDTATFSGTIDPLIKRLIETFKVKTQEDIEKLGQAVDIIRNVQDTYRGLEELDRAITGVRVSAANLTSQLQELGVNAYDALVVGAMSAVNSFRSAWESLAGIQQTPEQARAQAESRRALLLAEMKMYRIELLAKADALKKNAHLVDAGFRLRKQALQGDAAILGAESDLRGAGLRVGSAWIDGLEETMNAELSLKQQYLEAIAEIVVELDKLIAEVSVGKINLGKLGRGIKNGIGGGAKAEREAFKQAWKDALKDLKNWWLGLGLGANSPLTPQQRLQEAQNLVQQAMAAIAGGGQGGLEALQNLPALFEQLLAESAGVFGTSTAGHLNTLNMIRGLVEGLLGQELPTELRQQLEAILNGTAGGATPPGSGNGQGGINVNLDAMVDVQTVTNQILGRVETKIGRIGNDVHDVARAMALNGATGN